MTQEEKDLLIGKLLEQPDMLTAEETEAVGQDSELRELYNTAVLLKSASMKSRKYDVDKEWRLFRRRGKRFGTRLHKWAAVAIIMLSIGTVAATITFRQTTSKTEKAVMAAPQSTTVSIVDSENAKEKEEVILEKEIVFEDKTLDEIAKNITVTFGCKVEIADSAIETLRLYLTLPTGSTASDFVSLIDAYDMLEATMQDNVITIKKEAGR